jgi:hypothetical protein
MTMYMQTDLSVTCLSVRRFIFTATVASKGLATRPLFSST